jgi:hypothetical protein
MRWNSELDALHRFFQEQDFSSPWLERSRVSLTLDTIREHLGRDLAFLEENASFIFEVSEKLENQTRNTIELFRQFTVSGACPSLSALCIFAMEHFKVKDPVLKQLVLAASVMGEIENDMPYHNNMHYRKVAFQIMRMIAVYNDIYEGTARVFDNKKIAILLSTACIHDFGHDGKGNTVKGVYVPHRLEQNSYDLVAPVFTALGFDNADDLNMIHVMLLCTDVTPFKDPGNAVNQAKSAYRYHFLGGRTHWDGLNLDKELSVMEECPACAAMALMIHEADIATSAGLHYDITKYETGLLMNEISDGVARPENVINFLNDICNRQMLSEVGQQLFAANLARIYALAEEDFKAGNEAFPPLEESNFVLGTKSATKRANVSGSKSIN